jgi:hypothetical protein
MKNPTAQSRVHSDYQSLRQRVLQVAQIHRRSAVTGGAGRLFWLIGLPLLAILLLQMFVGLPFWLRLPVLPLVLAALLWLGWRLIARPLLERYTVTQAALLVEARRPQLSSKLVSALECYHDLADSAPRFDGGMVEALVLHTAHSTSGEDFTQVIDRRQVRNQLLAGRAVLALWIAAFAFAPQAMANAFRSLGAAWGDIRNIIQKAAGAGINIDPLPRPAYLRGEMVVLHATQHGFSSSTMQVFIRNSGEQEWKTFDRSVDAGGKAEFENVNTASTFEVYFASGRIESERKTVIVTEKPRIANLSVEYNLPEYAHHAPIVQARSDGSLDAVYGTTVVLTIRANKPIKTAELKIVKKVNGTLVPIETSPATVGGEYARAVVRLTGKSWLAERDAMSDDSYFLTLTDEYGYSNDPAGQPYKLTVTTDQPPKVVFLGLPHRTEKDEPHLLEQRINSLSAIVRASDDYGVSKLMLHYRVEDLETGIIKRATKGDAPNGRDDPPQQVFPLPRADIPQAVLLRFADLHLTAGDRLVFWAEAEDAYDLEQPQKGPHRAVTPTYRIAVVAQEESFNEVVYKDDWSTKWYDSLKVATLTKREIPPRQSPDREPAADVAKKLLEAPQNGDSVQGSDRQLVQDYFDSLNVVKK